MRGMVFKVDYLSKESGGYCHPLTFSSTFLLKNSKPRSNLLRSH